MPYAKYLIGAIEVRDAEMAAIAKSGVVDVRGAIANEVRSFLESVGAATVERISRDRGLPYETVQAVVNALLAVKIVETGTTTRGAVLAWLRFSGPTPSPSEKRAR